jgi:hypothetical protein
MAAGSQPFWRLALRQLASWRVVSPAVVGFSQWSVVFFGGWGVVAG